MAKGLWTADHQIQILKVHDIKQQTKVHLAESSSLLLDNDLLWMNIQQEELQ